MPIHRIELNPTAGTLRLWRTSDDASPQIAIDSFPGNPARKRERLEAFVQQWLDVRQPIADLPDDDPDKYTDPGRLDLFWDGGDLVGRAVKVTVEYDGTTLNIGLQRVT